MMSSNPFVRILDHLRDHGLSGLHLRFLAGLDLYREMPVYALDLTQPTPPPSSPLALDLAFLPPAQLPEYSAADPQPPDSSYLLWEWGANCFVARHQGTIVARVWAAERTFPLTYLNRPLTLAPDEIYILEALTYPAFRGQNVLGALLAHVFDHYRRQGRRRAYTIVFAYNTPSVRAFSKSGFRLLHTRGYFKFGAWRRDFLRLPS